MNIGTLDKRIVFFSNEKVKNELGTIELKPVRKLKCWARIEPARGKEYYEAQKIKTDNPYKITIRYRKNLNDAMIIKYQEHTFEIQNIVNPYMANVLLEIYCNIKSRGKGDVT